MRLLVVPAAEIAVVVVDLEGIVNEGVPETFVIVELVMVVHAHGLCWGSSWAVILS